MRHARQDVRYNDGKRINHNPVPININLHGLNYQHRFAVPHCELMFESDAPGILGDHTYIENTGGKR
jgi:hypothetical protein